MSRIAIVPLGWLGSSLLKSLKEDGHEVAGSYFSKKRDDHDSFFFDINDDNSNPIELDEADTIILNIPPSHVEDNKKVFSFIDKYTDKKILFVSSTSVYGLQGHVDEGTQPSPEGKNGELLLEIENYLHKNHPDFVIIRSAGQFGGERHPGKYLSGRQNLTGANLPINLVSQHDLNRIIKLALLEDEIRVINAVNSNHPQKINYYTKFCEDNSLALPEYSEVLQVSYKVVDTRFDKYRINSPL